MSMVLKRKQLLISHSLKLLEKDIIRIDLSSAHRGAFWESRFLICPVIK
jgi:hypothetical protein